jgi:queuosine precursor transporter
MIKSKKLFTLYQVICAAFCTIVVLSNIFSAKMVPLPFFDFSIPAGLIVYPLTFLLSDLVTEIYGPKRAKRMIYTALGMSLLSFILIQAVLLLPNAEIKQQSAFETVLGLSSLRIFSSLAAYMTSQIVDIYMYALIKRKTRFNFLWLRSNGSTWISQIVDTVVIDILFLYWGLGFGVMEVLPIMLFSYAYKAFFSVACTPLFYLCVYAIRKKRDEPFIFNTQKG